MSDPHQHHAWPQSLVEYYDVILDKLLRDGMDHDEATRLTNSVLIELTTYLGGRLFYLPKGDKLKNALRDIEIFKAVGKKKVREVAKEYGLTEVRVYGIIKKQRQLRRETLQE